MIIQIRTKEGVRAHMYCPKCKKFTISTVAWPPDRCQFCSRLWSLEVGDMILLNDPKYKEKLKEFREKQRQARAALAAKLKDARCERKFEN